TVAVTASAADHDLGEEIVRGKSYPFPKPFEGGVTLSEFNSRDLKLTWVVSGGAELALANAATPDLADNGKAQLCVLDKDTTVRPGRRCYVFPGPNAALAVWFDLDGAGQAARTLKLHYKAFRATPLIGADSVAPSPAAQAAPVSNTNN